MQHPILGYFGTFLAQENDLNDGLTIREDYIWFYV